MIKTISLFDFRQEFKQCNRSDNFSYEGLEVLFDYLESLEFDRDTPLELDVIEFCCEFEECDAQSIIEAYSLECESDLSQKEINDIARNYLEDQGVLVGECPANQSFVYRQH
jgi:hypothetical protein